jgi:hypothetical protein
MLPPTPIWPRKGRPMSSATWLRPPSAPMTYRARMSYSSPRSRSRTCTVTPSLSCCRERYSVSKRTFAPRLCALCSSTGSIRSCGMSQIRDGLAAV